MSNYLLYGRGRLSVVVPPDSDVTVVRKPPMPTLADPLAAVHAALQNPVPPPGMPKRSLKEMFAGAKSACIAICDITRPVPNGLFLRPLIESLLAAGVPKHSMVVVVATGLHRPNEGAELAELIGDSWVLENVAIVNHDARCDADHVDLGHTRLRNTHVKIDRRFVEADIRIATGLVEPHFMAGYSGGRKVIAPGLAHADTIRTFHNFQFMEDPNAANCNLLGNPLHDEQLEIVRLLGGALALNTVIDEDRNLTMVNFGDIVESHGRAVTFVRQYCKVPIARRFRTVVTCAAGYPLDKTYYQAVKGMVGAMGALQPGGDLIIAAECGEGLGSPEFISAQQELLDRGVKGFLNEIKPRPHAEIDAWQTQMLTKAMQARRVHLFSTLAPSLHALTGVNISRDINETVRRCIDASGDPAIAIIPEGPYVIPYLQGKEH